MPPPLLPRIAPPWHAGMFLFTLFVGVVCFFAYLCSRGIFTWP